MMVRMMRGKIETTIYSGFLLAFLLLPSPSAHGLAGHARGWGQIQLDDGWFGFWYTPGDSSSAWWYTTDLDRPATSTNRGHVLSSTLHSATVIIDGEQHDLDINYIPSLIVQSRPGFHGVYTLSPAGSSRWLGAGGVISSGAPGLFYLPDPIASLSPSTS